MINKNATVKDIAKKLGIHQSTVSRALRNLPGISPKTRKLVLDTAKKMNYIPNLFARNLKNNVSKTIGIIIPEIRHDFFSNAISGIEHIAYNRGYVPLLLQSNESVERESLNIDAMISNRVAGIIVSITQNTTNGDHFQKLIDLNIPLVFFDRIIDGIQSNKVISDDKSGAKAAVDYLIKKGYKKIAFLSGPEELNICKNRLEGYLAALKNNNIAYDKNLVTYGSLHEDNGYDTISKFLDEENLPDAIFTVNDPVAIGAFKKLKEVGLKIPDQIGVIGFSNNLVTTLIEPTLTTVEQYPGEMGKRAAQILLEQIESKEEYFLRTEVIHSKLIVRNST